MTQLTQLTTDRSPTREFRRYTGCAFDHAALALDDQAWSVLEPAGVRDSNELRTCCCGAVLERPLTLVCRAAPTRELEYTSVADAIASWDEVTRPIDFESLDDTARRWRDQGAA